MKEVYKIFLGHRSIQLYIGVILLVLAGVIYTHSYSYWYWTLVLLIAPFYEWLVHRYVLHAAHENESDFYRKFMDRLHRDHHKEPYDVDLLFAPIKVALFVPVKFGVILGLLTLNYQIGIWVAFVAFIYYFYYEWIHLAHHVDSYKPKTKRGKELKNAHKWHHFKNEHYWWGITSVFGDKILGTFPKPNTVSFSVTVKDITSCQIADESPE